MTIRVLTGDCLEVLRTLPDESCHLCCTSPPYYGLRDYGVEGAGGLEETPEAHLAWLVDVFREVRRVLRSDGCLLLNYGDAYATTANGRSAEDTKAAGNDDRTFRDKPFSTVGNGYKAKDLMMLPARVALALQADGWWIRSMMPWVKRSAMPESVTDRPASAIEYVFLLTKSARYFWDAEAVRQSGSLERPWGVLSRQKDEHNNDGRGGRFDQYRNPEPGRNFRNSDLFYASLEPPHGLISGEDGPLALDVNPAAFSDAHFATFSPKLIEPLIKAGTSEKGVCAACWAPWVREVETTYTEGGPKHTGNAKALRYGRDDHAIAEPYKTRHDKTLGWSPSCACKEDTSGAPVGGPWRPMPATVLDPFLGAGTTAMVADRLGRNCIGIELNPEYAQMARQRLTKDAGMFAELTE